MMKTILLSFFLLLTITISAQEKGYYQILLGYEGDYYSEPYHRNFNMGSMGFGYKGNLTAIYGKLNLGYLGGDATSWNNMQVELDFYQSLTKSKSTTLWLNYAYSQDEIFPNHRVMYEVWQKLPANFLISAGGRHYFFPDAKANILNVGLENYFSRYWVGFKTYFYLKDPKLTTSYTLTGRVFFKDINYFQLGFGIGSAQDESFVLPSDLSRLDARTIKVGYVQTITEKIQIRTGFTYGYEEYLEDQWRNRYSFGIGLIFNIR